MGNSSSKDERRASRQGNPHHSSVHPASGEPSPSHLSPGDRLAARVYANQNGSARGSRHDLSFLHIGRGDRDLEPVTPERPRETKQEREARRAERDRQARLKERERSMREENVDGGYLVTLGTYTGPEDFNKSIVRQLQIERRLAPFWQGLNEHSESWTEAQLVAVARGLPLPDPDEIPPEMVRSASQTSSNPRASDVNVNSLTIPIEKRSQSYNSDNSASLSASHPAFSSSSGPCSLTNASNMPSPLFRGRAKTLASTLTGKNNSTDLSPQEIKLPDEPRIRGQLMEAYLYKDASECPICFLYYPPYLNRTRCCDQSICSECFVQIKRPDPHPPEHEQPGQERPPEEESHQLVSEVAACPFCVTPEFGVTYEPPPFRRGLAYAHQQNNALRNPTSAMSSSSSLQSGVQRRRATSLSATSSLVITTDKVRPDWAKKLADARAHALRRSAAATALHNAAYILGNQSDGQRVAAFNLGRRRRAMFGDSPGASGSGTPREGEGGGDLVGGRSSSRRHRVEDIEELMMMEAIRLSLAAEEERKRKEEKGAQKDAKKRAKADKKEEKKADKLAKKNGGSGGSSSLYRAGTNDSSSTWASERMARSTSNLGSQPPIPEEDFQGKGKQPVQDFAGFNPLTEPTSTLNRDVSPSPPATGVADAQRHLEESRANLQPSTSMPLTTQSPRAAHLRQLSNTSSAASSFVEATTPVSQRTDPTPSGLNTSSQDVSTVQRNNSNASSATGTPTAAPGLESMFNFRSLAAMVGSEENEKGNEEEQKSPSPDHEHIENAAPKEPSAAALASEAPLLTAPSSSPASPHLAPTSLDAEAGTGGRSRGDSGESSSSAPPPIYIEHPLSAQTADGEAADHISPAPLHPEPQAEPQTEARLVQDLDPDKKDLESVEVEVGDRAAETTGAREAAR